MRDFITSIKQRLVGLPSILAVLWVCFAFLHGPKAYGQNVIISPETGKLIAAATGQSETGFENGFCSLWRHNQLALSITVADEGTLTSGGELATHAGNLNTTQDGKSMVWIGGQPYDSYMLVSIPKGYRFTGYTIELANNLGGTSFNKINVSSQSLTFYETGADYSTSGYKKRKEITTGSTATISRSSTSETDMGNRLYFRLGRSSNAYYGVTIKSFEIYFTAEADFTESVQPTATLSTKTSFTQSPFDVNKLEVGSIAPHTKNGKTYYSYDYQNVSDLQGYLSLYQQDAVSNGVAADVASTKRINAVSQNNTYYYGLGNDTYYIESPTTVEKADGNTLPVGYRITGATLHCTAQSGSNYYISYTQSGVTYYLNTSLQFTTTPTLWTISNGKVRSGNTYLSYDRSGSWLTGYTYTLSTTSSFSDAASWTNTNGMLSVRPYRTYRTYYIAFSNNSATLSTSASTAASVAQSDYTYTIKVYDKTGKDVAQSATISVGETQDITLTGLNNDAVKFSIEGLNGEELALVYADVTMQALDPYIKSLDIICHDGVSTNTLTNTFTSDNFAVRGGHFLFNVPESWEGPFTFTFENLKSDYADDTYYDKTGTGKSRYNFVESPYFNSISSLYDTSYSPDASYENKVKVEVAGTVPFRFNNIDELSNTSTSTESRELEEYPFSVAAYESQSNPGKFETFTMNPKEDKVAYLFTCDETRYNIAPTTATEHRFYAYYLMDIEVEKKTYTAEATLTPVYDNTNMDGDVNKAMYGVAVNVTAEEATKDAYLSADQIYKAVSEAATTEGIDLDQILYLDASSLGSIVYATNTGENNELAVLKDMLSPNALVYLPSGNTYSGDNFALKSTTNNTFQACGNIILKDKYPFYAPYGITVPSTYYAKYTRNITASKNGKVTNATLVLPFTLTIDANGKHTNEGTAGDGVSFTVNRLQEQNCMSYEKEPDDEAIDFKEGNYAHFVPQTYEDNRTEANKPYMIHVETAHADDDISFTALQYGSDIVASTGHDEDYNHVGAVATGTMNGSEYTFTPKGTYAGAQLNKNDNYFYFAKNWFLCSKNLGPSYPTLYIYPFRAYYEYSGPTSGAKAGFGVIFGENNTTTGIDNVTTETLSDGEVDVYSLSGMLLKKATVKNEQLNAEGLPSGVYVVGGKKVVIK